MIDLICSELEYNFHEYGIFTLLEIARKFDILCLKRRCYQELIDEDFEQMNYNRFDLFEASPEIFKKVIFEHQKYSKKGIVKGFKPDEIKSLIFEFNEFAGTTIEE